MKESVLCVSSLERSVASSFTVALQRAIASRKPSKSPYTKINTFRAAVGCPFFCVSRAFLRAEGAQFLKMSWSWRAKNYLQKEKE